MQGEQGLGTFFAIMDRHPDAGEPLGLLTAATPRPSGYDATPPGARTFAWTGGDGVHFSLLPPTGDDPATPVVMTVPMQFDAPNLVLGADLAEFLSLGLSAGFFPLEGLVHDRPATLARLDRGERLPSGARAAMKTLTRTFGLRPLRDIGARLDALQAAHGPRLG